MNLGKLQEMVRDRETWWAGVSKSQNWLGNWTRSVSVALQFFLFFPVTTPELFWIEMLSGRLCFAKMSALIPSISHALLSKWPWTSFHWGVSPLNLGGSSALASEDEHDRHEDASEHFPSIVSLLLSFSWAFPLLVSETLILSWAAFLKVVQELPVGWAIFHFLTVHSLRDPSSPTRDWTCASYSGSMEP